MHHFCALMCKHGVDAVSIQAQQAHIRDAVDLNLFMAIISSTHARATGILYKLALQQAYCPLAHHEFSI